VTAAFCIAANRLSSPPAAGHEGAGAISPRYNVIMGKLLMTTDTNGFAKELFRQEWDQLSSAERQVIERILHRISVPRDPNKEFIGRRTLGQRAADGIAAFGGSWTFILLFMTSLIFWAVLNTEILGPRQEAFDPYPYVFLNLILSMLAAIQAPVIMMSQNRQAARDRLEAEIDHGVNVRAELAIRSVDERMHGLEEQLRRLVELGERDSTDIT
jgi:uncharacterized membrane protein